MGNRARHGPSESQQSGNYYLFTVEENDYLTIYKIKSYLSAPLSNVITNFKMAKKTSLLLEYPVDQIEWITQTSVVRNSQIMNAQALRQSKLLVQPSFILTYQG